MKFDHAPQPRTVAGQFRPVKPLVIPADWRAAWDEHFRELAEMNQWRDAV